MTCTQCDAFLKKANEEVLQSANKEYMSSVLNLEASSSLLETDFAVFSKKELLNNRRAGRRICSSSHIHDVYLACRGYYHLSQRKS